MPVTSETRKAGPYIGNGIVTSYAFAYKVFSAGDVRVVRDGADLELGTHYNVSLNADQEAAPGGAVNLVAPLAAGASLEIISNVRPLQNLRLLSFGGFYPGALTDALDRLMICIQQVVAGIGASWAGISGKPSTLAGYGIEAEADARYLSKGLASLDVVTSGGPEAVIGRLQATSTTVQLVAGGGSGIADVEIIGDNVKLPGAQYVRVGASSLQAVLDAKAAVSHAHAIADVTGLQSALNAKSDAANTDTSAQVDSKIAAAVFASGSTPTWQEVWSGTSTSVAASSLTGGALPGMYLVTSGTSYAGMQGVIQLGGEASITNRSTVETRRLVDSLSIWEVESSSDFRLLNVLIPLGAGSTTVTPNTITAIYRLV